MKFYQVHVPKTGGRSLWMYAKKHKLNWKSERHIAWSKRTIPKGSVVITALRCPIKHTKSLYSYWNNGGTKNPNKGTWQWWALRLPFSEWLRHDCNKCRLAPSSRNPNLYVRFFGDEYVDGELFSNFDKAVANLKSIDYVLDTSKLSEQFEKIANKYKIPPLGLHINKSPKLEISNEDVQYIRERRAQDFELCKMFGIETL